MTTVCRLLERHLPIVLVSLIDSFFTKPITFAQGHIVGTEGHPEYVLDINLEWKYPFKGIIEAGYDELAVTYIAEMKGMNATNLFDSLLTIACKHAKDNLAAELIVAGATTCRFCGLSAYEHVARAYKKRNHLFVKFERSRL